MKLSFSAPFDKENHGVFQGLWHSDPQIWRMSLMTPRRFFVLRPWILPKPFQLLPNDKARGSWVCGSFQQWLLENAGTFPDFLPKKEVFLKIGDFEGTALLFRAQAFQGMWTTEWRMIDVKKMVFIWDGIYVTLPSSQTTKFKQPTFGG